MSHPHSFECIKLVVGCLFKDHHCFSTAQKDLKEKFGNIDFKSPLFPFDFTSYYEGEMGRNLWRAWIGFERLVKPSEIPAIKTYCYEVEKKLILGEKRQINLDPGFLSFHNFILTSFKNFTHRIPLEKGVYADLTLVYNEKEGFKKLPWTYPDYNTQSFLKFLCEIRKKYKMQMSNLKIAHLHPELK